MRKAFRGFFKLFPGAVIFLVTALQLSPFLSSVASAQVAYRVTGLGSLQGDSHPVQNTPFKLNDSGQVVGYTTNASTSQLAVWKNGAITNLGTWPSGTIAYGHDINNLGDTVGVGNDRFGQTFGLYNSNGQTKSLLYPSSGVFNYTTGAAINDSRVIVGWGTPNSFDSASRTALRFYNDNNTHPVPLAKFGNDSYSAAFAINNAGTAVGYSAATTNALSNRAVMWNVAANTVIDISGSKVSAALAINNSGTAAGYLALDANNNEAATFSKSGPPTVLTRFTNETSSVANSINDSGFIVGSATGTVSGGSSIQHAFISASTLKYDLNDFVSTLTPGWTLNNATDINSQAQIVGQGTLNGVSSGFIATPELYRQSGTTSQAWEAPGAWTFSLTPGTSSPVYIEGTTVLGPLANTKIAELDIGLSSTAELKLGTGILTVGNQDAIWATGVTIVGTHGTLSGSGTLVSDLYNYGTVSPGSSPGTLNINGNAIFESNSTMLLQVLGTSAGQYDVLNVSGSATLGGNLQLDFTGYAGSTEATLKLFTAGTTSGSFDKVQIVGINPNNVQLDFSNNSLILSIHAVPEPVASVLTGIGVGMILLESRRRRGVRPVELPFS